MKHKPKALQTSFPPWELSVQGKASHLIYCEYQERTVQTSARLWTVQSPKMSGGRG